MPNFIFIHHTVLYNYTHSEILINRLSLPQPSSPYKRCLVELASFPFLRAAFTVHWKWDCRTAKPGETDCVEHILNIKLCSILPDIASFTCGCTTCSFMKVTLWLFVVVPIQPELLCGERQPVSSLGKQDNGPINYKLSKVSHIHVSCFSLVSQAAEIFHSHYL